MTTLHIETGATTHEVNPASANPVTGTYNPAFNPIGADDGKPDPATSQERAKQLWINRYGLFDLGFGWHGHPELGDETLLERGGAALQHAADHRDQPLPPGVHSWLPPCPGASWSGSGPLDEISLYDAAFVAGRDFLPWVNSIQAVMALEPGHNTPPTPHGGPMPVDGVPRQYWPFIDRLYLYPTWSDPAILTSGWPDFAKTHEIPALEQAVAAPGYSDFDISPGGKGTRLIVPGSLAPAMFLAWDATGRPKDRAEVEAMVEHLTSPATAAPPASDGLGAASEAEAILAILDEAEGEALAMTEPDVEALIRQHTSSAILQKIEISALHDIFGAAVVAAKKHLADKVAEKLGA